MRKHLLWIIPLLALTTWSLLHGLLQPPTLGEHLLTALQQASYPPRPPVAVLEYIPPPPQPAGALTTLTFLNERLELDSTVHRVVLDLPPTADPIGREVILHFRGAGLDRTLRRAADFQEKRPANGENLAAKEEEWTLRVIGNELTIPRVAGVPTALVITASDPSTPPLQLQVRAAAYHLDHTPATTAWLRQRLEQPALASTLLAALRQAGVSATAASALFQNARQELLSLNDHALFLEALRADAGFLRQGPPPQRAVQIALLLAVYQPRGVAAVLQRDGRILYAAGTDEDTAPLPRHWQRSSIYCFDAATGQQLWQGTLDLAPTLPQGSAPALLYRHAASTPNP